ncbi:glycosyltransferase family 1 protein [Mesorhizobium sp. M00.F.Ca.ET.186.01.1.1]|nr:glycosyltransferase family 1 protein [bacterium M00.F.Ca.ET.205.01.1.1]TGU50483.1 glycosyltransferase family 1 protein [bacterium M00.F.Ca.ET.152.01.1.1]TGV33949.1 glycosyltransferase family 1 protein [Mesorhizobium sp. M00.F.Ca.ET.186.01.1.1]TGZ40847.1 glycosyltransferase family 1 protein [bacterium M00.F.Ca.ET.162.01.1.1]
MTSKVPSILILGTRGIPAAHGGFETFAERLALFLAGRGWKVGVYCQDEVERIDRRVRCETWRGIELIHVQVASKGPRATLEFDWQCARDAARRQGVCLVLGYNGALFLTWLRLFRRKIFTNMDGIEWRRPKWGPAARSWFWLNEWIGAWMSHRLVADHPVIADHLATRRPRSAIATIPYGGDPVTDAPEAPIRALGLEPGKYLVSIARVEPDNNILSIVEAFGSRDRGDMKLVVLGSLSDDIPYHVAVRKAAAANGAVVLPGAIYDQAAVKALRYHARAYMHGHTVGGTNPSLVEALAAGNMVIAHDNPYNRWTAGAAAIHFTDTASCAACMDRVIEDDALVAECGKAARVRAREAFRWEDVLIAYENEAYRLLGVRAGEAVAIDHPSHA